MISVILSAILMVASVLGLYHSLSMIFDFKLYILGSISLISYLILSFIYITVFLLDSYEYNHK